MRGVRLAQLVRFLRSLLLHLAQATQSKARLEKTVEDGALRTGFPDGPHNKAAFLQLPLLHGPLRGAYVEPDRFCSFRYRNASPARLDVVFASMRDLRRRQSKGSSFQAIPATKT